MIELPTTPSFRLDNRKALVTGAYGSIGLGCSVALAEAGANVTISGKNNNKLNEVVGALNKKGFSVNKLLLDISDINSVRKIIDKKGPFEILVNSAGIAKHSKSLDTKQNDYNKVMDINTKSAYFLTQAVAKGLIKNNKPGSLINISSQMGHVGGIDRAVYSASKHAMEGFTKSMAIEFGKHKIRVNTICPTFIKSNLTSKSLKDEKIRKWINSNIKLNRLAEVNDIMGAVVFLSSDASNMVTGSSLKIDGGWTAG